MKIEISDGEILDKYSILNIKCQHITDINKLSNIHREKLYLTPIYNNIIKQNTQIIILYNQLIDINQKLWNTENSIRIKEKKLCFDEEFIYLARNVYKYNDERARIKKEINILTQSNFIEEKSYEST